jgi:putative ABC transport system substrate-binding protein
MDRRAFITLVGGSILAVPLAAEGQAGKVPRIGMIGEFSAAHPFVAAFRQGLGELGYAEGQSIVVETATSTGRSTESPPSQPNSSA